jgi:hypothetical protein
MAVIHSATTIRCTPEQAFDYLVDIRSELEWNPRVETVSKLTDGPVGRGTRFKVKWKSAPQPVDVTVVEFDRPRGWVTHNGGPMEVTLTIRLDATPDGTILRSAFDARPHGWFRLVFPFFLMQMRREERANMTHLRNALEQRAAGRSAA